MHRRICTALWACLLVAAPVSGAETIVLQSGFDEQNSVSWSPGQFDAGLTYLTTGTSASPFGSAFSAADFLAAQNGKTAYTIAPLVQNNFQIYAPSLFAPYPLAQWINTGPTALTPYTTLYALPFQVATTNITSAALSMKWAVDDSLGDATSSGPNPVGVYLNGTAVPSAISGGDLKLLTTAFDPNIGPLLQTGQNWLYIYDRELGGPGAAGVMFGATITVVPEPAAAALAGIGMLLFAGIARRRRQIGGS